MSIRARRRHHMASPMCDIHLELLQLADSDAVEIRNYQIDLLLDPCVDGYIEVGTSRCADELHPLRTTRCEQRERQMRDDIGETAIVKIFRALGYADDACIHDGRIENCSKCIGLVERC